MPELGSLWYSVGLKDLTDADIKKINDKLKSLGSELLINPKLAKSVTEILPKGIKLELDPQLKAVSNEALAKAAEGKVMKVEVMPLISSLRKALKEATKNNPPEMEVGVQSAKLRKLIEEVLNKHGFMLNISTVNDNYSKVVQQKLNGTRYTVRIHADAKEITRSVQASLMQMQSRAFGLQISRDILYRSIDDALGHKRFIINVAVQHDQARKAVQDALLRAQVIGKDQALAYQRLQTGELKAAQAELARLKAAHMGAADAAKAHATASVNLGGALGSNIKIAGELSSAMASLYSVHAAKEFLSQVIEIGGELEHQKIAMDTIFGDKGKTSELFGQIKGLARQSPFGVMELTKSVKALSAYGVQYNEIYDTAKRLADISAATSVDINRLILAFGKTKSRGFLDGLEAKQFAYANIPIYEMVRRKLEELEGQTVTTAQVMERMKKREIGFDIVKDVLWDMTDEGGKFYNMQEALAGSVKTSWKLVRDNIELMFGEIAESSVGGALKSIAEILQTMTRNWRTMGAAVASVVTVLGLSKIATYGLNRAMEQSVGASTRQILADKKKEAARLRAIRLTSSLTAEEERLIRTSNRLTAEDIKQAYAKEGIAKETVRMLYLTKQLSAEEVKRLATMGMIDAQTAKSIVGTNRLAGAYARLKVSLGGIRQSIGMAMGSMFNWTTAIFAAIGALVMLWQRNSEFNRQAKETSEDIYSKAAEGANNLKKALEDIKPSAGLSEHELTQGIAQMQQAIKDYSPTPIKDINEALTTQDGHLLTLVERYEALRKKVGELKEAFDGIQFNKVNKAVENALADTKEGWFFDGLEKNLKDYENAKSVLDKHIRDYSVEHKEDLHNIVESASKQSEAYRNAIRSMSTDAQKFYEVIFNGGRYSKDLDINLQSKIIDATEGGFWQNAGENITNLDLRGTGQRINAAYNTLMADAEKFKERFNAALSEIGIDPESVSPEQLSIALNSMLDKFEVGEDSKALLAKKLEELYNITLIDDKVTPIFTEKFREIANASSNEAVQEAMIVWQTQGWNKLSQTQKDLLESLFEQAKTQSKGSVEAIVGDMNTYLASHPGQWNVVINMVTSQMQKEMPDWTRNAISSRGGEFKGSKAAFGYLKTWGENGSQYGARNAAQQALQDAENELKSYVTEADKLTPAYKKALQKKEDIQEAINYLGWGDIQVKDQKSNKHSKGSQKDPLAESLKQRFKDIKDAYSMFKEWAKLEGKEAAFKRVGESGLFATLDPNKVPQTVDEYLALIDDLEKELKAAGVKGKSQRENLARDLINERFGINKDTFKEQLQLALNKVSKEAERQLANYNLFKKLEKETGNRQFAMNFAFGIGMSGQTDYESLIKDKFNAIAKVYKSTLTFDTATPDLLAKAPEEVRKAWEEAYSEIQKYRDKEREDVANMVEQYRSTQEEIVALTAEAEEKKRKIRESKNLTPVEKQQITAKIDADLNYEVFRKSGEYLKFFNAILSMTGKEAEDVGRKIKEALDEKLKAGRISAKDYCDEMEKIDKQLEKIRQKQKGFGGLGSFAKGGLQQMFKDRFEQAQSDYNAATQNFDTAKQQFDLFSKEGNEAGMQQAQSAMDAASAMKEGAGASMQGAQGAMSTMAVIDMIVHGINDTVQGIKGAFELIKDMADSYGVNTSADTDWGAASAFLGAFSEASQYATDAWDSLKSGNIGGVIQGVVGSITSWFTTFNRWHDAKLQEQIEKSKQIVQNIQYAYDAIERRMENFLGNKRNLDVFDIDQAKKELNDLDREIAGYEAKRDRLNGKRDDGWKTGVGIAAGAGAVAGPLGAVVGTAVGSMIAGIMTFVNKSSINKINKKLNGLYEERERIAARIAAYEEGGSLGLQRQMMTEQLAELEKQKQAEEGKKKSDEAAIKDYEDQIDELTVKIQEFGIEMAKEIYGIDLNSWAEQLGDALVDAFAAGGDAAEAFDNTVSDIMRSLVGKMLTQDLIAPMFDDIRDYLFGENGVYSKGATGGDFEMSEEDAIGLAEKLAGMKGIVEDAKAIYDQINAATDGMLDDKDSKSGLSAGIQSVTEDTADLLASYINQIRADVAMQTGTYWTRLLDDSLPQMNVIAQSQLDTQHQIAENTLRNAVAAEAIVQYSKSIDDRLRRAQADKSTGFWMK